MGSVTGAVVIGGPLWAYSCRLCDSVLGLWASGDVRECSHGDSVRCSRLSVEWSYFRTVSSYSLGGIRVMGADACVGVPVGRMTDFEGALPRSDACVGVDLAASGDCMPYVVMACRASGEDLPEM